MPVLQEEVPVNNKAFVLDGNKLLTLHYLAKEEVPVNNKRFVLDRNNFLLMLKYLQYPA